MGRGFGKITNLQMVFTFKPGIMSIEDMPRPGRTSTGRNDENIAKIKLAIHGDRQKTIDQISEETNVPWCAFMTMHQPTQL
ncbi:hypothetical protein TNCV_5085531 [Trichonephila clavipes]|uniref:Uncharacterized protein n=1 Tax=Trichonephila clavipes TaxID=2585209 RepID=A0A8X6SI24_TRICX|nr:hypothetical protein TNCV_5085531 [Trichonephila clavipes]